MFNCQGDIKSKSLLSFFAKLLFISLRFKTFILTNLKYKLYPII